MLSLACEIDKGHSSQSERRAGIFQPKEKDGLLNLFGKMQLLQRGWRLLPVR